MKEKKVKSTYIYWLSGMALAVLVGCGPTTAAQPTPIAVPTSVPAATSAPAVTAAPTAAPTAVPAATAAPQPTAEPTVSAEPTATPAPTSLLPNDVPWVHSAGTIFADDESFDIAKHGLPAPAYQFQVAPDGTMIAYMSQPGHLIVADMRTSQIIVDDRAAVMAAAFVFAPDSRSLFFTTTDDRAGLIDLPGGQRHDLTLGAERNLPNGMSTGVLPIAWIEQGILAQQVLWGTDAPAQGVIWIDPTTGAVTPISKIEHISAALSPDGTQIAFVTGNVPIGDQPTTGITLLDLASGQATPLVPEQPQLIRALRWSPDGARLLYASMASYDTIETKLQLINVASKAPADPADKSLAVDTYRDIAWSGAQPLLLTAEKDGLLHLYWVELSDQGIISLAPAAALAAPSAEQPDGQIIYAPR